MIQVAFPGTVGLATLTSWMTLELFMEVIKHFFCLTCSLGENPILLIFDNVENHLFPQGKGEIDFLCNYVANQPSYDTHKCRRNYQTMPNTLSKRLRLQRFS